MFRKVKSKRYCKALVQMAVWCLMLLYIGSTLSPEQLHSLAHQHEDTTNHSDSEEQDPCHRTIYHNDSNHGCEHDSHLIVRDDCQGGDHIYHGDYLLFSHHGLLIAEFLTEHFDSYKQSLDSYWAVISSSRAPPATYLLACA